MAIAEQSVPEPDFITVDSRGRRLAYSVLGSGTPTVVLEAGLGGTIEHWRRLPGDLAPLTRVVSYDRAGLGPSDPGPAPRTSQNMVADLHALLHSVPIPGPYILVGHSLGGLNVRLYTARYPDEVHGLVLIDPTPPTFQEQQLAALPPVTPGESAMIARWRAYLTHNYFTPDTNVEQVDLAACCRQVAGTASLGDRPLILVNGGRGAAWTPDVPMDIIARLEEVRRDLRREVLQLSSNSRHVIAEGSGHYVHHDRPDIVLAAIRQVVHALATGARLN